LQRARGRAGIRYVEGVYYRVDYTLALLAAGALLALLTARRLERLDLRRVARGYLIASATITAIGVAAFVARVAGAALPTSPPAIARDLGTVLVGGLYGAAIAAWRGRGTAALLREPELQFALRLSLGVGFALAGVAKPFSLDDMNDFFAVSHYSKGFLNVVIVGEALGGLALLLPWRPAVLAALAGFAIDMFGAFYTHAFNGDPLDDSTGAVGMLFRIALLAALCVPLRRVAIAAVLGAALAVAGAAWQRHDPPPPDELDAFTGRWHCAGTFANGTPIEADMRGDKALDGRWLVLHYDDAPPARYHALSEWTHTPAGWVASIQDSAGGLRTFRSAGWDAGQLTLTGHAVDGGPEQRFVYRKLDGALEISFDRADTAGWQHVDTVTCRRL
jgi:uncharacterized membrane protein YphA (DoxX/SURF4 family)